MITVDQLLRQSHLPGPRANLALLHAFAAEADEARVQGCLRLLGPETEDSPEEFAGMCGVVGGAAMAIQALTTDLGTSLDALAPWTDTPL